VHLCFFNSSGPWGGGEQWHYESALMARDKGYRVTVIANIDSVLARRLADEKGIELFTLALGSLSFLNPLTLLRLARLFRKQQADTVILCLPRDVKAGGLAAKLAGVRDIIYRRGIAVPVRNRWTNRLLFKHVITKLIVNSQETRRCVLGENPGLIAPERIFMVHCGLDVADFDAKKGQPLVPRAPGQVVIGNAARLTKQKGQRLLIEAAALLKGKLPNFRVLIAGTGELEAELKEHARKLGVEREVEFLGFVTDMRGFHESLDIFALPSLWEGFCIAQMEAMCTDPPVVAFRVSSIPEVLLDGETGLLSEPDAGALADNLLRLAQDENLRRRMGAAGRQRVCSQFDVHKVFGDLEKCLRA